MKIRLFTILLSFLLPLVCHAQQPEDNLPDPVQIAGLTVINIGGGVTAAGGDPCGCPASTYTACWTGDHASGGTYLCYDSGASSADGSLNETDESIIGTTNAVSGNGMIVDADEDDNITWASGVPNKAQGTVWLTFYNIDQYPNIQVFFEAYVNASAGENWIAGTMEDNDKPSIRWAGNNNSSMITNSTGTGLTQDASFDIGFTWKTEEANSADDRLCIKVSGGDADWICREGALADATAAFDRFVIGNAYTTTGASPNTNEGGTIDNVVVTSGFQDADPR